MSEHIITTADEARAALLWMARRRKLTLSGLCVAGGMSSKSLVQFASTGIPDERRQKDADMALLMRLVNNHEHQLTVRNGGGGKAFTVVRPGIPPVRIATTDDRGLWMPATDMDSLTTAIRTIAWVNGVSLTGLCELAGVSLSIVKLVNSRVDKRGSVTSSVRLSYLLRLLAGGGFEMVLVPAPAAPVDPEPRRSRRTGEPVLV